MRRSLWLCAVSFAVLAVVAGAQMQHAPDGGTREMIQSIDVPTKAGAPFRAQVATSWKRRLEDGTETTIYNRRTIARDSMGRVFQERRVFRPDGNTRATIVNEMDYYDPSMKTTTVCHTLTRQCMVYHQNFAKAADDQPLPATQTFPNGVKITRESLGTNTIEDLQVTGMREIRTSGSSGDAEPTVKEFWYSPRLGMNLVVKRFEPRGGAEDFNVEKIDQTEPDASLFNLPRAYQVIDIPAPQAIAQH
ncbi:hypothetical protein [Terriglobus roseus]|uniref:DUF3108 domain-containing protein n=1 Tax=Terriglobus roseus TaxID=392734 RepID=A0A1G7QL24_9BACT|nr:hypothetical protein [Terriglobus roseus]SDF98330.1 hypothetical protein SAMN05444167_3884 [Terriglobus roseus]